MDGELPSCPVCLERLDPTDCNVDGGGQLTTICNHTFHYKCLSRWEDSSCPVCRYSHVGEDVHDDSVCDDCAAAGTLRMCMICGHIGCDPDKFGHALAHFHDTGHVYALELSTQRVWDYGGDGYVCVSHC